ncbi:uncharacterized protein LOC119079571 [Bradysia coprophila]|uniref:uncharacterized protein LOC119079571 n=1 Tax=Bradysia coprophila TaxID=38358 RepID=UPI00187D8A73|nr:uncharacterized protein LOC119079571 [Bradysia coprophila]
MKLVIFMFLVTILACIDSVPCSTWRERMQKYSALLDCQYFLSTDSYFNDYFPLEEMEGNFQLDASNNGSRTLRFYIIGQNQIKFRLSQTESSDSSNELLRFIIGEQSLINHADGDPHIRSMKTPNIVREDEPNEIRLEILEDGKLKLSVNEILTWDVRGGINILDMKYFSFASGIDGEVQELFYKCTS